MKRSKPLARTPLKRGKPIRRKAPRRLKRDTSDPAYLDLVRRLPCAAFYLGGSCIEPIQAHHPRHLAGGISLKAPDAVAVPLCLKHHGCLHSLNGPFKGWTKKHLHEWQDWAVARTQERLAPLLPTPAEGKARRGR